MTSKADTVSPPLDNAVANDFNVRKFTALTTHLANALPASWSGQYVTLYAPLECDVAFSRNSAAEVSTATAATAAGASANVGMKLPAGATLNYLLPEISELKPLYFCREAAVATTVWMALSSR